MTRQITFVLLISVFLCGCADLDSISRTTPLPADDAEDGVAIHLDAKQRLVLAKSFGSVCAEPSPDALSSFTASLGGSISSPGAEPDTLAAALQSTAASIGLRTQSITLMRDALYRICEAYYGKALTGPAVMTLLAQSQALTAAILAIEQLTRPVVANQVILQGEALARSSEGIVHLHKLLSDARADEQKKKSALDQAIKQSEKEPEDETKKQVLKSAETAYIEAKQLAEELKASRDAALSAPSVMVRGHARFNEPTYASSPDMEARKEVAAAVKEIVQNVLDESYVEVACIALIADNPPKRSQFKCKKGTKPAKCTQESDYQDAKHAWTTTRNYCLEQLTKDMAAETN